MKEISYKLGDATIPVADGKKIIAHICNDIGAWGSGFTRAISKRWPEPEASYRSWFFGREYNDFGLGAVCLVEVENDILVANMIAQKGVRSRNGIPPIQYEAVQVCLKNLCGHASHLGASVHMPRIGCGLAGGNWIKIEPIIAEELLKHDVTVTIYDLS